MFIVAKRLDAAGYRLVRR